MITDTTYTSKCSTLQNAVKSKTIAFHERLKELYPCVDDVTKLPQAWAPQTRATTLGLTHDNLGCYFRGRRVDDEKAAASVRADNFIPPSCLLYYFEIKFISKGREGYMGLGLSSSNCSLEKLPGWERESYAYHADDGMVFDGNPRGTTYGPKSTTGDIVGCGYNLVEGKIFFTQNGLNVGKAFDDIPSNILFYPTIGLKTHGEEILANFGQEKFAYDIEQDLRSLRKNMTITISNYPISNFANWQSTLHKLVQSWLLQNSYPETAVTFSESAKIECKENMQRVQQRNRIQQLVLNGKISEAIKMTNLICPNLLQNNPSLLFTLKCRQFIELISGAESDFQPQFSYSSNDNKINIEGSHDVQNSNSNGISLKLDANGDQAVRLLPPPPPNPLDATTDLNANRNGATILNNNGCNGMSGDNNHEKIEDQHSTSSSYQELMDVDQPALSGNSTNSNNHRGSSNDLTIGHGRLSATNEKAAKDVGQQTRSNGTNYHNDLDDQHASATYNLPLTDAELDNDEHKFAKLIQFGQELCDFLHHLNKTFGKDETKEKMLQDAIGLIAYINPKGDTNIGKQLDPKEREPISQLLNSSILNSEMGDSSRPPLEEVMNHLRLLVRLNNSHGCWLVDELY